MADSFLEFVTWIFGTGAEALGVTGLILLSTAGALAVPFLAYYCLTLPLRRAERARLFLDFLKGAIRQGLPLEEIIISLSQARDQSMGMGFHLLAARLETGLPLEQGLTEVSNFLPPQVRAMLLAGRQIGDLSKILSAARHLLADATSQMRGALSYLVLFTFVTTPLGGYVLGLLAIFVIPKFMDVTAGMGVVSGTGPLLFLKSNLWTLISLQDASVLLVWLITLIYIGGPRLVLWFPILEKLYYLLPWRRRRMQRDFSTMLALLLDSGVPEAAALTLAADCAANSVFRRRAALAVAALGQGMKLPEAVQQLDDSGEFRWRLRNAVAGPGGFLRALAGWHESLDARAFQQEQAAAHVITTSLVLWSGMFVGLIVSAFFLVLTSLVSEAALW